MYKFFLSDRPWAQLRLAVSLLALAVVGWGLHYKLTLYAQSAGVHASAPAAKLLSQKERASPDESLTVHISRRPAALQTVLCFAIISLAGLLRRLPREEFFLNEYYFSAHFKKIRAIRPPPTPIFLT